MYRIVLNNEINKYEIEELIKVFLRPSEYSLSNENKGTTTISEEDIVIEIPNYDKDLDIKNNIKRHLYNQLKKHTGVSPDWGILTGVRPVKLTGELIKQSKSVEKARRILMDHYYLNLEKADLLIQLCENQSKILKPSPTNAVSIYIGIPFCPTRCVYCSFTSNQAKGTQIQRYLEALDKEITFVANKMKEKGLFPETIYVGGGTPTTISPEELNKLLIHINNSLDLSRLLEFTVEAGRPDTITKEKLKILKEHRIDRISINPQSMKDHTLELIGRSHKPEDIILAFQMAKDIGIPIINADIIAGLPDEDEKDFSNTIESLLKLDPENITVHTLALKRASKLKEINSDYNYSQGKKVKEMLEISRKMLKIADFHPYYLYRQKQMIGNFENVGYAKPNTDCIYNIRIMEEMQTIIALGAGGITKVYYQEENRLERVANVSNFEIYIERIDEMLQRKAENLFGIGGQ